jgi:hypothetical protein
MPAVPRLCDLNPGICLTTEEKSRKPLLGQQHVHHKQTVQYKNNEQYNTQKENRNTEQYVTEQYRTLNTQQRKQSVSGK